jgi:hypothetical protein
MRRVERARRASIGGAGMIEMLIVIVLVAVAAWAAFRFFGGQTGKKYECAGDAVDRMGGSAPAAPGCDGAAQRQDPPATPSPVAALPGPQASPPAQSPGNCASQFRQCSAGCGGGDVECSTRCSIAGQLCTNPDSCNVNQSACRFECRVDLNRAAREVSERQEAVEAAEQRAVVAGGQAQDNPNPFFVERAQQAAQELAEANQSLLDAQRQLADAQQEFPVCEQSCEDQAAACRAAGNPP